MEKIDKKLRIVAWHTESTQMLETVYKYYCFKMTHCQPLIVHMNRIFLYYHFVIVHAFLLIFKFISCRAWFQWIQIKIVCIF